MKHFFHKLSSSYTQQINDMEWILLYFYVSLTLFSGSGGMMM